MSLRIGHFALAGYLATVGFPALVAADAPRPRQDFPPVINSTTYDLAEYLAFYQTKAAERARGRQQPATANQASYDVHYYDLDLNLDPANGVLTGTVRTLVSVVVGSISSVELDLSGVMIVDGALVQSAPATFSHTLDLITVDLDRVYSTGEMVEVTIQYHGDPVASGFGSFAFDTHNGLPHVWTLSEPFGAHDWWPCKDQAEDKADSVDVRVTTPSGMITASNGVRISSTDDGTTASTHWRERYPIATYLVSLASFAYATSTNWYFSSLTDSMPLQFFVYPENAGAYAGINGSVGSMITNFTTRFGPYPFLNEKYGHAEFPWGGGMEHQTCTSLGAFYDYIVAHELSHQWWGDAVTCRDFHHIWLNEGFATYSEALYAESWGGLSAYRHELAPNKYFGSGTIYVPDLNNVARIFSSPLSYNKASWVLHMLRRVLGDAVFFDALRAYQLQYRYSTATTEDFQHVCEAVSGRDLTRFFQQWIYGEYYPKYRVTYASEPAGGGYDVHIQLQQAQTWQLFWMPVDLTIRMASGESTFVAMDSLKLQSFTYHMPRAPVSVAVDKNEWILRTIVTPTAVEGVGESAAAVDLSPPSPNPSRGDVGFVFSLPRQAPAHVFIVDAGGRRVGEVHRGTLEAGSHAMRWNGRDKFGRPAAAGLYWVCVDVAGRRRTQKLAIVR